MRRFAAAAFLAAALAAGPAAGGPSSPRFTPYMDGLLAEVITRNDALGTPTDKAGKKLKTAYTRVIAELSKDTVTGEETLAADASSASKALKLIEKALPGDGAVDNFSDTALSFYFGDTEDILGDLRDQVSLKSDTRARDKALKALDAADDALEDATNVASNSGALKGLVKALLKGVAVQKYLDANVDDHGACLGRLLAEGENFLTNVNTLPWIAVTVESSVTNPGPSQDVSLTWWVCDAVDASSFTLTFTGVPAIGTYAVVDPDGTVGPADFTMVRSFGAIGSSPQTVDLTGTLNIDFVDEPTGTYAGLFNVSSGVTDFIGSFRVVGVE